MTKQPIKTVGGSIVRNVKIATTSDCNCSLSKPTLIGEILVGDMWHSTKWNLDGTNISGVERWNLNNTDATNIKAGNI